MSDLIKIRGQLVPQEVDTPLDARVRVSKLADISNISNPYVGCLFYCAETDKLYIVKTLKAAVIGGATVQKAVIDTYEELTDALSLNVVVGAVAPSNPTVGMIWVDTKEV